MKRKHGWKKIIICFLLFALGIQVLMPLTAYADDIGHKKVRVGWYDSSFCYFDEYGRRCGIDYEYQQKISAYTGWTYEYVQDSWPNLLQMLKRGEIDILSDVSYKPEREADMLFTDLPMGTESYYIYISEDNRDIEPDKPASFKGKKIGVNRDSIQEDFLKEWVEKYDIDLEIIPLSAEEDESMDMVVQGKLDGYASIFMYESAQKLIPSVRIGGSDYFYAVNKKKPDLLAELNAALAEIHDEDPYFNQMINQQRTYDVRTYTTLLPEQEDWIRQHGPIRIGYRDDYLPFCDMDNKTGELTGALKDYLAHAQNVLNRPYIQFETIPYNSTEDALYAVAAGEIDCYFPVNLSAYDADQREIRLTNPVMKTEMNAIMRTSQQERLSKDSTITLAVVDGMMNIETFIMEHYPKTVRTEYAGLPECYKAVAEGRADGVLVSNYRIPSAQETLEKYKLFSVPTGESMNLSFAVRKWDTDLYFLMNKTAIFTKSEEMDSALASYMEGKQKVSFMSFLKDNWLIVVITLIVVFSVIILLLVQKNKAERTAHRQKILLKEAEEVANLKQTVTSLLDNMPGMNFTKDAKTGKYLACNQAFAEYAQKKKPEEVVGLTPGELFDEETAKRYVEDDTMALSMDRPYIFYDEIQDRQGQMRPIKMTKIKYTDESGRECVLGIFQEVMDSVRITRDKIGSRESYERAVTTGIIYTHIAQTLAHGYRNLFYVDLNSEEYISYQLDEENGSLIEKRRAFHFFEECMDIIDEHVFEEDQETVRNIMDRRTLVAHLDEDNAFMMTFRLKGEKEPDYVSMKIYRMQDDERFIIIALTDVSEQMKEHNAAAKMREERIAYNRISALAGEFFSIYMIDPKSGKYREFSATSGFENFDRFKEGEDFFSDSRIKAEKMVYPDDQGLFMSTITKERVLGEVEKNGLFTLSYRIMLNGEPRYVQFKAVMVEEDAGPCLIVGFNDIDAAVRQEEEYGRRLAQARIEANIDALTGVKNRNAYRVYEERLNAQIEIGHAPDFAIIILDVNDLKKINDNEGHKAGDQYLRDACSVICTIFKRSPVFRVGGDEFCVLSQGEDYLRLEELTAQMNRHNDEAVENGGIVVAIGAARYESDEKVASVYERADKRMYENKSVLKARKK